MEDRMQTIYVLSNQPTINTQQNDQQNNNYIVLNTCGYLFTGANNYTVTNVNNNNYVASIQTQQNNSSFQSSVALEKNILELAIKGNNQQIIQQKINLFINNPEYQKVLDAVLDNYIAQNQYDLIENLYNKHGFFTKKTLDFLIKYQLKNKIDNIDLTKDLFATKLALIPDFIESLLESTDENCKKQQIKQLADLELLHDILNDAVNQKKTTVIEKFYFTYYFATKETLNYLLKNSFSHTFNLKLVEKLISEGATITETIFDELVKSEDLNKINNIVTLLANHEYYNKIVTSILYNAIHQDKPSIVQMLYSQHNFFSVDSLDYLLQTNLKNGANLTVINQLIARGAVIKDNSLCDILKSKITTEIDENFIDNYIKLARINFSEQNKKTITDFHKKILQEFELILAMEDDLSIIELLYFDFGIITQDALDYILALEPAPKTRYHAELAFEEKYKYSSKLNSIVNDI